MGMNKSVACIGILLILLSAAVAPAFAQTGNGTGNGTGVAAGNGTSGVNGTNTTNNTTSDGGGGSGIYSGIPSASEMGSTLVNAIFSAIFGGILEFFAQAILFMMEIVAGRGFGVEDYNFLAPPGHPLGNQIHEAIFGWALPLSYMIAVLLIIINFGMNVARVNPPKFSPEEMASYSMLKLVRLSLVWPYRYGLLWFSSAFALTLMPPQEMVSGGWSEAAGTSYGGVVGLAIAFNLPGLLFGLILFAHVVSFVLAVALTTVSPLIDAFNIPTGWAGPIQRNAQSLNETQVIMCFFPIPFGAVMWIGYYFRDAFIESLGTSSFLGAPILVVYDPIVWFAAGIAPVSLFFFRGLERQIVSGAVGFLTGASIAGGFGSDDDSNQSALGDFGSDSGGDAPDGDMTQSGGFADGKQQTFGDYAWGDDNDDNNSGVGGFPGSTANTGSEGVGGFPGSTSGADRKNSSNSRRALGEGEGGTTSGVSGSSGASTASTEGVNENVDYEGSRRPSPDNIPEVSSKEELEEGRYHIGTLNEDRESVRAVKDFGGPEGMRKDALFSTSGMGDQMYFETIDDKTYPNNTLYVENADSGEVYDVREAMKREKAKQLYRSENENTAKSRMNKNREKFNSI